MKKYLIMTLTLFILFSFKVFAIPSWSQSSNSVPSNSQYTPVRNYGFQINWDDSLGISTVLFEWNGIAYSSPAVQNIGNIYWINLTNLAAGTYSYRWYANNTIGESSYSDQWSYTIIKNFSVPLILTLNGAEGNRSYKRYSIANFVASLNIPNKIVRLESNYPNWATQTNTSVIYNSTNLSALGLFTLTASSDEDQNYTSLSKTYYFDSAPPQFSDPISIPNAIAGYSPNAEYKFQVNCKDATLVDVWFESNHTGTMKKYYSTSNVSVQNSSGVFWITLKDLGIRKFSYRWQAKDSLNDEISTDFINYEIIKMTPLVMDILPSTNVKEGTQITATCYSINPLEVPPSKFNFYKNSEIIENISITTRMGVFLLSLGTYNFTCNTSGTGNYSNQSITRTIAVSSAPPEKENITGELKITNVNFPSIKTGESEEASFNLFNDMLKNIFNITINIIGISSEWYGITSQPSSIYSKETKEVKIVFDIPPDAETKTYSITIFVEGKTSDEKFISATENLNMIITGPIQNKPPYLFDGSGDMNIAGTETTFSLEWSDDFDLSGYIFSSNNSGVWENDSWIPLIGKTGLISVTKELNSNVGSVVAWKVYANDSSNEWSVSNEYIIITEAVGGFDMFFIVIIIIIIIVVVFTIIFIRKRRTTEEEKEIEYVYSREEMRNEKKT